MTYLPRVVDAELKSRLASAGAVLIEGPKACGKTETARQVAASEVLLDVDQQARQALAVDPPIVLDGPVPRLIDEWQLDADIVWNHVRRFIDSRRTPGQFILTGSSVPEDQARRHSGAGRFSTLRMRPMALCESGHSTGQISLSGLMAGTASSSPDPGLTVSEIAERVAVGGWPANIGLPVDAALRAVRDYLAQTQEVDVGRVAGGHRDPQRVGRLMASLARNVATEVTIAVLASEAGGDDGALSRHTVYDYLDVLQRIMIVEDQPAWAPHLRSKATLRSSPKRHFVDPSLAVAALGATPSRLLRDIRSFGYLYESMVIRDLRVYAQPLNGTVYHYRDSFGLEVDAIVQLGDGRWGAFEIKLGANRVDEGAKSLLKFSQRVDPTLSGTPSVLAVIAGTGYGYVRPDGVTVIPLGALGP